VYSNSPSAYPATAQHPTAERFSKISLQQGEHKNGFSLFLLLCVLIPLPFVTGCDVFSKAEAEPPSKAPSSKREGKNTSVDVAIAKTEILEEPIEYIGTTRPVREVSLRAQVEGRLLNLQVDVGNVVKQGQILARLDDSLLVTSVTQSEAELAALQSEVARAQTQVQNAQAQAEQARAELKQAQVDAQRLQSLSQAGAIAKQQAELAQTNAATAQQKLNSATAQIATEQQAVAAAKRRVDAQRAAIAQARERQSYTLLASPITGVVVAKVSEPGNLVQPGGEVLRLADFSSVKIVVPVSELALSKIQLGTPVQVRLDAFTNEEITGRVTLISPAADASARQVPVEITIPNSNGRIGSGLLARVSFEPRTQPRVVIPETALQGEGERGRGGERESRSNLKSTIQNPKASQVFVVTGEGNQATVQARAVSIGTSANGKVEILSGLQPGERFVTRSEKPLKDGDKVRLSILSKTSQKQEQR
jgi:multidrug efflux pump subunit AcrA (membrane-fusion protein)